MAPLPNDVPENFLFVSPTTHGPGISVHMLLTFIGLIPKVILYGTLVTMMNQLQKIKYAMSHESYLNAVMHRMKNLPLQVSSKVAMPYGSFASAYRHISVELQPSRMVQSLRHFMKNYESYIQVQATALVHVDKGVSFGDSHKLSKHICVIKPGGNRIHPFAMTFTVLDMVGIPNMSIM